MAYSVSSSCTSYCFCKGGRVFYSCCITVCCITVHFYCSQLKRMTKGYKSDAASKGYEQRAAEPIYSGKIKAMLEFLMLKQQTLPSKDKLLLIRDGLLISMLWQSCFRGFNVGGAEAGQH